MQAEGSGFRDLCPATFSTTPVGKNNGRLLQHYGVHKAKIEVRKKGYTTRRQTLGDGDHEGHDEYIAIDSTRANDI